MLQALACLKLGERPLACEQNVTMGREEDAGSVLGMTLK